jgi:hypothetical protein
VRFTRAGCDWGAVGTANTVLENTGPDVPKVFGANSPEAQEVKDNPGQAFADFVGVAVHCAQSSPRCTAANHARPDLLPDEPGGYTGFQGLFGAKYVNPVVSPSGPMRDLDGNVIQDAQGHVGFPGFDGMFPSVTLSYIAAMQEHGIPVTFGYISDAHDNHGQHGEIHESYGPGEAGYVAQLKRYDDAFAKFFDRLAADGITKDNTLFVFTVEEGDHFAGGPPKNAGCDGVNTPCQYDHVLCPTATVASCSPNDVGEINGNLRGLLATQRNNTTGFAVHADMAPAFYLNGNPARDAAVTRNFERDVAALTAPNPLTGRTDVLTEHMIDRVGMQLLHMVTADPLRTPTFVMFAQPDYFLFTGGATCTTASPCIQVNPGFAWNHGGDQPEIATTWAGFVGPGVQHLGETSGIWADHTDLRPTILTLTGLSDDYVHDGRVLIEMLSQQALPASLQEPSTWLILLGRVYKQLTAPFGEVGQAGMKASTAALESSDAARYNAIENEIASLTAERDAVAARIRAALEGAAFGGQALPVSDATQLVGDALRVIARAQSLAVSSQGP